MYQCNHCTFTTATAYHLKTHQETHDAQSKGSGSVYACGLCSYRTLHRYNLIVHQRTHTGELPYKCPTCGKKFSQASTLRRHEKIHNKGEALKPQRCPFCTYYAYRIVNIHKHIAEKHSTFPCVGLPTMVPSSQFGLTYPSVMNSNSSILNLAPGTESLSGRAEEVEGRSHETVLDFSNGIHNNTVYSQLSNLNTKENKVEDGGNLSPKDQALTAEQNKDGDLSPVLLAEIRGRKLSASDGTHHRKGEKQPRKLDMLADAAMEFECMKATDLSHQYPASDPNFIEEESERERLLAIQRVVDGTDGDFVKNEPSDNLKADGWYGDHVDADAENDDVIVSEDVDLGAAGERRSSSDSSHFKHKGINERIAETVSDEDERKESPSSEKPAILNAPVAMYGGSGKKYKCDSCSFSSNFSYSLKTHQLTHQGEKAKVFKCSYCPYRTALKHNLVVHQRVHTGEMPYRCTYCDKTFAQQSTARRHERTHTGQKPHTCPYCPYGAYQRSQLKRHVVHTHGKQFPDMLDYTAELAAMWPRYPGFPGFMYPQPPAATLSQQNNSQMSPPAPVVPPRSLSINSSSSDTSNREPTSSATYRPPILSVSSPTAPIFSPPLNNIPAIERPQASITQDANPNPHDSDHSARISSTTPGQEITDDQLLSRLVSRGRVFKCDHCSILFLEYAMYLLHKSQHDTTNPLQCNFCGRVCNDKFDFMSHFVQFHERRWN